MKIRILQCVESLNTGGITAYVVNLFHKIDKDIFQVDFIIFERILDYYEEVTMAGSTVYIAPQTKKKGLAKRYHDMRFVYHVLSENMYDIIHCNSCSFKGLLTGVIPASCVKRTKVIAHSHNIGTPTGALLDRCMRRGLKKYLSALVDMGFACSDLAGKSKFTDKFMEGDNYYIIRNAIDTEKFRFSAEDRESVRAELGIGDAVVIGSVGRIEAVKNQIFLLELLEMLRSQRRNVKLLLVGDGSLRKDLEHRAEEFGIVQDVIFAGKQRSPGRFYSAMDVLVMPSFYEGFPFTAVEAQVNGLKCVVSDVITRMVNISCDVVFLPLKAGKEVWAEAVLDSAKERTAPEKTKKVEEEYSIENEAKRLERIYGRLAGVKL